VNIQLGDRFYFSTFRHRPIFVVKITKGSIYGKIEGKVLRFTLDEFKRSCTKL
jgi:hypothetical protein